MEKLQNQMTQKEQRKALQYFNEWINKGNATTEHANPTQENCYISNNDIWGIYFPNTQITLNNRNKYHYNFLCVSKNNYNVLGVVYSLKSEFYQDNKPMGLLQNYKFEAFNELYDSIEFENLYTEIKNTIIEKTFEIETLKSFRQVTKKDGGQFKEYNKNFLYNKYYKSWNNTIIKTSDKNPIFSYLYNYELKFIYRIDIHMTNTCINLFVESYQKETLEEFAPNEIIKLVKDQIIKATSELEQYKNTLENLQKVYKQFKRINGEYINRLYDLRENNKVLDHSCEFEYMKKRTF